MNSGLPEFDGISDKYSAQLEQGIKLSGESKEFFASERIKWLKKSLLTINSNFNPEIIIDFGCGTGTSIPYLLETFSPIKIIGLDISKNSLEIAKQQFPEKTTYHVTQEYSHENQADLIFCNGVFHHIPLEQRLESHKYIYKMLKPGGFFAMWDNNPWNLGTRIIMKRIPFDRDAVMMWPRLAVKYAEESNLNVVKTDFCFIFPRLLKPLRVIEKFCSKLPLGAQYLVLSRKSI